MTVKEHWEQVYSTRMVDKLGWYKPRLDLSLEWISDIGLGAGEPIIDVGGGASTLIDDLVDEGFESLTVLDISESALEASKKRLGRQADLVMWLCGDITTYTMPEKRFALWHDRAMFHFLTDPAQQEAYRANLLRALRPGGHAIIACFAPEAPPKCSGLPVQRYDSASIADRFGDGIELVKEKNELHITPGGVEQMYVFSLFRRSERPGPADGE